MPHSSADPILDRRFAYAEACAGAGDHAAAADILAQIVAERPDWTAAWFRLGEARLAAGDRAGAAEAFRAALARDPADRLGAGVALAALGEGAAAMSPAFVAGLFDEYAPRFDAHLAGALAYRGPDLLRAAIEAVRAARGGPFSFAEGLDLGCGTGLFAEAMAPAVTAMHGVDLSAGMVARARRKGVYTTLEVGDIAPFLAARPAGAADLIAACDVLPYVGDLAPVFRMVARALAPVGLFACTVQAGDSDGYAIGEDRRVAHGRLHVEGALAAAGLAVRHIEAASTRLDRGRPIPGLVVVASHVEGGGALPCAGGIP